MSIEKKIDELIAALDRNTQAITAFNSVDRTVQKVLDVAVEAAPKPTVDPVDPVEAAPKPTVDPVEEKPQLKYEDMVIAFRQYIGKHGRDKAVEVLTTFGITGKLTADQLPESRYQEFLDALK